MKGTKEFYELTDQFEKDIGKELYLGCKIERVKKDEKVPSGFFYHNGKINDLFHAYMLGYSNAKCIYELREVKTDEELLSHLIFEIRSKCVPHQDPIIEISKFLLSQNAINKEFLDKLRGGG